VVGDADSNTAHSALEIAKVLLIHRESAARRFVNDAQSFERSDLDNC
jgi:hypothetical protein